MPSCIKFWDCFFDGAVYCKMAESPYRESLHERKT